MLRVPTLNPAPTVAEARPRVRRDAPDAEAFGSGLGVGIQQASRVAFGVWQQEAQRVNEARILDADTQDAQHDLATRNALAQVEGADAPKAFESAIKARQERQAEIEKGLSNPTQRDAFRARTAQRLQSFENWGSGHVVQQTRVADDQAMQARIALDIDAAKADRNDSGALGDRFVALQREWNSWADRRQLGPEVRAQQQKAIASAYVESVIDAHVSADDDIAAKQFAQNWGGHLTGEARQRVDQKLKITSTKTEGQRRSAAIWSPDKTLESMMAEADQIDNQDVQAAVKDRLANLHTLHQRGIDEAEQNAMRAAWDKMQRADNGIDSITTDEIVAMGPARYAALQGAERRRIQGPTVDPRESARRVYALRSLAVSNPTAFAAMDLTKPGQDGVSNLTAMSPDDFKAMASLQAEVKDQGTNGKLMQEVGEKERIIAETLAPLKIKPTISPDNGDIDKVLAFRQQFDQELNRAKGESGRPVSTEAAKKIAAALSVQVVTDRGWLWDTSKPLFQVVAEIPADERAQIVAGYKKAHNGAEPTTDAIALMWRMRQESGQ